MVAFYVQEVFHMQHLFYLSSTHSYYAYLTYMALACQSFHTIFSQKCCMDYMITLGEAMTVYAGFEASLMLPKNIWIMA